MRSSDEIFEEQASLHEEYAESIRASQLVLQKLAILDVELQEVLVKEVKEGKAKVQRLVEENKEDNASI